MQNTLYIVDRIVLVANDFNDSTKKLIAVIGVAGNFNSNEVATGGTAGLTKTGLTDWRPTFESHREQQNPHREFCAAYLRLAKLPVQGL